MRNRIVKHLVSTEGVTAVALETSLAKSKLLYDYVLGTSPASDSALQSAFSYGFGALKENIELVRWLRAWNAGRADSARVRIYGMDLTGQMASSAAASVEAVLGYLIALTRTPPLGCDTISKRSFRASRSSGFPCSPLSTRTRSLGRSRIS